MPTRSVASQLVGLVLGLMLVLTTPVGTGSGVHASELLHPVLPHLHMLDGRLVADGQLAAALAVASADAVPDQPVGGLSLGAGSGADAAGLGLAIGPTLRPISLPFVLIHDGRLAVTQAVAPAEYREAPQDRPPDRLA